jgi:hypothetical protein
MPAYAGMTGRMDASLPSFSHRHNLPSFVTPAQAGVQKNNTPGFQPSLE